MVGYRFDKGKKGLVRLLLAAGCQAQYTISLGGISTWREGGARSHICTRQRGPGACGEIFQTQDGGLSKVRIASKLLLTRHPTNGSAKKCVAAALQPYNNGKKIILVMKQELLPAEYCYGNMQGEKSDRHPCYSSMDSPAGVKRHPNNVGEKT